MSSRTEINPFVARFTPPSSVTSAHNKLDKPLASSRQSSALDIPAGSGSLGRHVHVFPLSPADTASPYLAASGTGKPVEPASLSLDLDVTSPALHNDIAGHVTTSLSKSALKGLEKSQTISPAMLARDHLPRIMLGNGSLATRHIMSCLAQTIPGFSRIPPHKARKMLVDALETRTVPLGDGTVEYRRAGRGRWDARISGDPFEPPITSNKHSEAHTPSESDFDVCTVSRPGSYYPQSPNARGKGEPWSLRSLHSHDEALDDMSMDDASSLSSGAETEAEDWSSMGPQAMKSSAAVATVAPHARINYNAIAIPGSVYSRRFSSSTSRSRRLSRPALNTSIAARQVPPSVSPNEQRLRSTHSPQEQEAIEALMQMGSM